MSVADLVGRRKRRTAPPLPWDSAAGGTGWSCDCPLTHPDTITTPFLLVLFLPPHPPLGPFPPSHPLQLFFCSLFLNFSCFPPPLHLSSSCSPLPSPELPELLSLPSPPLHHHLPLFFSTSLLHPYFSPPSPHYFLLLLLLNLFLLFSHLLRLLTLIFCLYLNLFYYSSTSTSFSTAFPLILLRLSTTCPNAPLTLLQLQLWQSWS